MRSKNSSLLALPPNFSSSLIHKEASHAHSVFGPAGSSVRFTSFLLAALLVSTVISTSLPLGRVISMVLIAVSDGGAITLFGVSLELTSTGVATTGGVV